MNFSRFSEAEQTILHAVSMFFEVQSLGVKFRNYCWIQFLNPGCHLLYLACKEVILSLFHPSLYRLVVSLPMGINLRLKTE